MLDQQLAFLTETDKLKSVERKTSPIGLPRKENSAEHSWQAILAAIIFAQHAEPKIDLLKVVTMLALHDIPEIDCGDVFHYAKTDDPNLAANELAATKRILGLLPIDQAQNFLAAWQEFEARQTPEAKFAHSVDRLMAFIVNRGNQGGTWKEFNLSQSQVLEKNAHVAEGSPALFELLQRITTEATENGYLTE